MPEIMSWCVNCSIGLVFFVVQCHGGEKSIDENVIKLKPINASISGKDVICNYGGKNESVVIEVPIEGKWSNDPNWQTSCSCAQIVDASVGEGGSTLLINIALPFVSGGRSFVLTGIDNLGKVVAKQSFHVLKGDGVCVMGKSSLVEKDFMNGVARVPVWIGGMGAGEDIQFSLDGSGKRDILVAGNDKANGWIVTINEESLEAGLNWIVVRGGEKIFRKPLWVQKKPFRDAAAGSNHSKRN